MNAAIRRLPVAQTYDPRAHGALCDECPANNTPVVPPTEAASGMPKAIIVGQEPGFYEVRNRTPFVGPSGKRLDRVLQNNDLNRSELHVTNATLCLVKDDDLRRKMYQCCKPRLDNEIAKFDKSIPVIPMGNEAFRAVHGRKTPITKARGFIWQKDGRDILPTLHPAFVLRDGLQWPLFSRDWKRIALRIRQGYITPLAPRDVVIPKSVKELNNALAKFSKAKWLAVDVETSKDGATRATLQCVGISDGKFTVVIPWMQRYASILSGLLKNRVSVGHNFIHFDAIVLKRHGVKLGPIEDTLIAHHGFASHMRQGMDHLASVYLDVVPWKILYGLSGTDEKGQAKGTLTEEQLLFYNSYDAYFQAHLWMQMQEDVKANASLYEHDKRLAEVARHMQEVGVLVDEPMRQDLSKRVKEKVARLYKEMVELAGREFSPTKPNDIRIILFEHFCAPMRPEDRTATGLASTNKTVLQRFADMPDRPYGEFCKRLIAWRTATKIAATHIDRLIVEGDGRVHCAWRSFATPTGRFSARGPNLCNLKRPDKRFANEPEYQIRDLYIAAPGHKLVGFDASQIEPRVSAYRSGDPNFIAAVETGDVYYGVAKLIFGDIPELATRELAKTLGKFYRDATKIALLGVTYGAQAEKVYETFRRDKFQITFQKAVLMLTVLRRQFKRFYQFVDENLESCRRHGYLVVGMLSGRKRWLGNAPAPTEIANSPIQGGAADVMNAKLIKIYREVMAKFNVKQIVVKVVGFIYDAVIIETPEPLVPQVEELVKRIMAEPVRIGEHDVHFKIDFKIGHRWSEV